MRSFAAQSAITDAQNMTPALAWLAKDMEQGLIVQTRQIVIIMIKTIYNHKGNNNNDNT